MNNPAKPPPNTFLAGMWLLFHGGILLALGISLLASGQVKINTNLFDILPASRALKAVAQADKALGSRSSRQVYILAGCSDFARAKAGAEAVYNAIAPSAGGRDEGGFERLSLYVDASVMEQLAAYLREYRYALLDAETQAALESGAARDVASDALAAAFGPWTMIPLDSLETDPFLLAERNMQHYLAVALRSGGSVSVRDDVLALQYGGMWYVMLRGVLSAKGAAITNEESAVKKIYAACEAIAGEAKAGESPDLAFVYSGIPFHSYESSSNAQKEISLISTITLAIIITLFLFVFRSPLPALASVLAAGASIALAASSALLIFREVHVITFVFGTTLIGTCVDYSLHYFIHWSGNPLLKTGPAVRSHILRGISLSIASTAACFLALLFAPFAILKQFAVFSAFGLFSSFLTVVCLYPLINKRFPPSPIPVFRFSIPHKRACISALFAASVALLVINRGNVRIENNIGGLYAMSDRLMESEKIAAAALNHGASGSYFIVSGSTPEETLQREERLCARLDSEIGRGNLQSYMAASLFIPSIQRQKRSWEAAQALLPLAEGQFAAFGFPPEDSASAAAIFRQDFAEAQGRYAAPGKDIPPYLQEVIENLWIGSIESAEKIEKTGQCYSCVLPLHTADEAVFRGIADEFDAVFFVDKVKDIGGGLDSLTRLMLLLFLVSYALIGIMVKACYPWRTAAKICALPVLLALATAAVLACLNIPLGFFSVVGFVLALGLGLDYIFYITESEKDADAFGGALTRTAIALSFATTALSFGALALSSFAPVHIFGLTVFVGLAAVFVFSMLMSSNRAGA